MNNHGKGISLPQPEVFDMTIIGAGPTGLFGAFYAGLREMKVKVIDILPQPGGQLTALYPEKMIFDTPGFPSIRAKDLVQNLEKQALQYQPRMCLEERAEDLRREPLPGGEPGETCWVVKTDRDVHYSHTTILAAGIGAFHPIKLLNNAADAFEHKVVEYMVKDLEYYRDKRVLIVRGGDSAVDWALALEPIAEKATLIHRREGFRAHDSSVNALHASNVDVRIYYELRRLEGEEHIQRAVIFDNRSNEDELIDVDAVILSLGYRADLGPIREWGLETNGRRYIKVDNKMETNLPGVFASGDVAL